MGEKLFDDLARALVQPVPRSRALRLIGSVLVATSLPGAAAFARTRRPTQLRLCSKAEQDAGEPCCPKFVCKREDGYGNQECCLGETCCGTKNCCEKGTKCGEKGTCGKCPNRQVCGPKCCTKGQCCPRSRTARPEVPLNQRWICCKPPNECIGGRCKCPSGHEICNGTTCCKQGDLCRTCWRGETDGNVTNNGRRKCCPEDYQFCCGNTCCFVGNCCGDKCCPEDTNCANVVGGNQLVCCPSERTLLVGNHQECCPEGMQGTASSGCCPEGQDYC